MIVNCDFCTMRAVACGDCVVTVMLRSGPLEEAVPSALEMDEAERAAIAVLAQSGLIPPLRLVEQSTSSSRSVRQPHPDASARHSA